MTSDTMNPATAPGPGIDKIENNPELHPIENIYILNNKLIGNTAFLNGRNIILENNDITVLNAQDVLIKCSYCRIARVLLLNNLEEIFSFCDFIYDPSMNLVPSSHGIFQGFNGTVKNLKFYNCNFISDDIDIFSPGGYLNFSNILFKDCMFELNNCVINRSFGFAVDSFACKDCYINLKEFPYAHEFIIRFQRTNDKYSKIVFENTDIISGTPAAAFIGLWCGSQWDIKFKNCLLTNIVKMFNLNRQVYTGNGYVDSTAPQGTLVLKDTPVSWSALSNELEGVNIEVKNNFEEDFDIDSSVKENSGNLVTSGAVYTAI